MSRRIALALTFHNHQPVGNFGWVIEETHRHAYLPMVETLERHPGVRVGLHYTGPLLEWLLAEHPDFIARLRALVTRGQVEILGGGYFEPVLASLPERDRLSQLTRMADEVERLFGRRPTAAWLAERVWEPDLPTSLVGAGYQSTIVDDAHFRAAAIPEDAMWGPYTTDDQGKLLTVFGTEQGLRYRIPFRDVSDVIDYLTMQSKDLSPDKTTINFVWMVPTNLPLKPVTLNLKNVPLSDVLKYVTQIAGLKYRVEANAVVVYKPEPEKAIPPATEPNAKPK